MDFLKICASNNDFVLIDNRNSQVKDASKLAQTVCRRRYSVGADGLILLENSQAVDFKMRFLNPDGGEVSMCGNGTRAISLFARRLKIIDKTGTFETAAGLIETEIINEERVKVKLTDPHSLNERITLNLDGLERAAHFVDTGVPHVVMKVEDLDNLPLVEWGRAIRKDEQFAPAGTNANFIQIMSSNYVRIRTYERGVEDETLACGTGSVAGAVFACLVYGFTPPVKMLTQGGEELLIHFEVATNGVKNVYLEGQVVEVFEGKLVEEIR